ncbi:unnamed protein product [Adineta steineri]|uniref:RRM domain-containing protein n=1 Tax=Adineta steineri TaxID=433720 RepID=A0A818KHS8_9BILA|nr:unnamed protein product [Adineta steineri]
MSIISTELFVDGICELDDRIIQSYLKQFGSRITNYESHRKRLTDSCCFALISFTSHHSVNTILRRRPHIINSSTIFVKRLLSSSVCSFIERQLPVTSLFVYNKISKQLNERNLRNFFKTFGHILKFERDYIHDRLFIEYDDYDSVDKVFLNKDQLPDYIDIYKNILPQAQDTAEYRGKCRLKQHAPKKTNECYQGLLQKTIEDLGNCKAQLKNIENDYNILQIEHTTLKEKYDKLDQLFNNQNLCRSCNEHEVTIMKLQQTLSKLNEQYETTKSQYQRLLSTKSKIDILTQHNHYLLSTRLKNDEYYKSEVSEYYASQSNLSTANSCDINIFHYLSDYYFMLFFIALKQRRRITYKYNIVKNDED